MKTSTVIFLMMLLMPTLTGGQQTKLAPDTWKPFKYFLGKWEGSGNGQPGNSKTQREYRTVLNDQFIQVQNRSIYDPQPKNPKGETHEDLGMISYDKSRRQFVLRQFHLEGFVNQYVLTSISEDDKTIVFTSEAIENIPPGFRARETYKILGPDEFIEVFEIAEPGKDFETYSESRLRRTK